MHSCFSQGGFLFYFILENILENKVMERAHVKARFDFNEMMHNKQNEKVVGRL
jgi:hypothetical protein